MSAEVNSLYWVLLFRNLCTRRRLLRNHLVNLKNATKNNRFKRNYSLRPFVCAFETTILASDSSHDAIDEQLERRIGTSKSIQMDACTKWRDMRNLREKRQRSASQWRFRASMLHLVQNLVAPCAGNFERPKNLNKHIPNS